MYDEQFSLLKTKLKDKNKHKIIKYTLSIIGNKHSKLINVLKQQYIVFSQAFYSPEVINLVGGLTSEAARVSIEQNVAVGRGMEQWRLSDDELTSIRDMSRPLLISMTGTILADLRVSDVILT